MASSLPAASHVERPAYAWIGVGLQTFVGLMAIPVGTMMVLDPTGSPVGIPQEWIVDTPFASFLVPGLFLLLVNGLGQLAGAVLAIRRHWLGPWVMGALGIGLLVWIAVQVMIIPLSFLQPMIFIIGLLQGFIALFWLRGLGSQR